MPRSESDAPCRPKTGWLSGETYCKVHGRTAGWPCSVASPIESRPLPGVPDVFTGGDTTYGAMRRQARAMAERDWNTPTERGLAMSILAIIEDFERELTRDVPPEKKETNEAD